MIAIVCGGRDYSNESRLRHVLDQAVVKLGLSVIIEGECPTPINADKLARKWAEDRGDIGVIAVPAGDNWPEAGPIRNAKMGEILLGEGCGDRALFAFPGGRVTKNMIAWCEGANRTRNAGIRIIKVDWE